MAKRYDINLDPVAITTANDLPVYESDETHIQDTIQASKGSYKENPLDGVQINMYLNSSGQESTIAREVILQLKTDGYRSESPVIGYTTDGNLSVKPNAVLDI